MAVMKPASETKFAADKMLGRLVRWLRVIGQDVIYGPHLSHEGLVRAARREGRLILTRDRTIKQLQPPEYIFVKSDHFREQLKQIVKSCRLDPFKDLFTRCLKCNNRIEPIEKELVRDQVPSYVYETQNRFSICKKCRRILWPATHQKRMIEELKSLGFEP